MWTPNSPGIDPRHDRHDQLVAQMQALNGRIDGLSRALRVDLSNEQQLSSLLRCAADQRLSAARLPDADRRLAHKRLELCGLVVMRYALMPHTIDALGRR